MKMKNNFWKQPVPTNIFEAFGNANLQRDLFIHLYLHTRNKDMEEEEYYKGKPYKLRAGQSLFGKEKYSKRLRCSGTTAYNALVKLSERQDEYQIERYPSRDYTVISIIYYDKLKNLTDQSEQRLKQQKNSRRTADDTNKNVKNENNIFSLNKAFSKTHTDQIPDELKEFNQIFDL